MTTRPRAFLFAAAITCACSEPTPATVAAASPLGALEQPRDDDRELVGVVGERLAAGRYSYLRVDTDDGARWVATTGPGAALGAHVRVRSMGMRSDFYSPRLERRFDELVFGFLVQPTPTPEPLPS